MFQQGFEFPAFLLLNCIHPETITLDQKKQRIQGVAKYATITANLSVLLQAKILPTI